MEEYCANCGVSGDSSQMVATVGPYSISILCRNCAERENALVVKKPTSIQLKEAENQQSIYNRLAQMSGTIISSKSQEKANKPPKISSEITLKDLLAQKIQIPKQSQNPSLPEAVPKLINNFHWHIMRERQAKHLTHRQLAEYLGESEYLLKMIEQGSLPGDAERIISKLEQYFQISLSEKSNSSNKFTKEIKQINSAKPQEISKMQFKPVDGKYDKDLGKEFNKPLDKITLIDLYERKKKREEGSKV